MGLHVQHPSVPGVLDQLCQELSGWEVREPQPCPSGGSLGLVCQQGHGGQVWVSILPSCPTWTHPGEGFLGWLKQSLGQL